MRQERNDEEFPSEAMVLEDIRYFEACIAALEERGRHNSADAQVCRLLVRQRRQLLSAIRNGMPERWREYSFVSPDSNAGG